MKHFTLLILSLFFVGAAQAQLVDPSFEEGALGGTWEEASTNFGTPLCIVDLCGTCGGPCAAYEGSWYAWFGGATAAETGVLSQTFDVPSGSNAELSFWFFIPTAGDALADDVVFIRMDGDIVWGASAADFADWAAYTQVTLDVSAWADGGSHTLSIEGYQTTGVSVNFLMDAFALTVDGDVATDITELMNHEKEVLVFPNPANEVINLQFGATVQGDALVSVFNLAGQMVMQERMSDITNTVYTLNTDLLEAGLYTISVENGTERFQERVLVTK